MNPFSRKLTASLAGVIFASSSLMVVGAKATQTGSADTDFLANEYGLASAIKGVVTKSQPTDASRSSYGEFMTVKDADKLPEGTLVKTGDRSTVTIDWMANAKSVGLTRLWANSIATVSTKSRLVHLQKGELFHNKTKDSSDHIIETKLLQARIHGTTVHVKVDFIGDKEVDKILVLETGSPKPVEVLNRANGSRVMLRPGIVLEVSGALTGALPQASPVSSNMCLKPDKGELIFQDSKTQTKAFVANSKAALEHPAVRGGDGIKAIQSIDLIRRDMSKVPSSDDVIGNFVEAAINVGKPDKLITKNLSIGCVPTKNRYYVGPNVGQGLSIELPSLAYSDFHPAGRIADADRSKVTASANPHAATVIQPMMARPIQDLPVSEPPKAPNPQDMIIDRTAIQPSLQGQIQQFNNIAQQQIPVQIPVQTQIQTQIPAQTQLPAPITPMFQPLHQQAPQQNLSIVPFNSQGPALPIGGFNKTDNLQVDLRSLGKAN